MREVVIFIKTLLDFLPNTLPLYLIAVVVMFTYSFVRGAWHGVWQEFKSYLITLILVWVVLTIIGFAACIYADCSMIESLGIALKFSILLLTLIDFGLEPLLGKLSKKV